MSASSLRRKVVVPPAGVMDDEGAWSPWADLQPELAGMVFCRLLSYGDRLRFRAVCRRWRLAARQQHPLPPALPWLNLDRMTYQSLPDGEVHRIPVPDEMHAGTVCRGSFDGWLLYDRREQLECFLRNPISKAKIDLPYYWHCDDDDEEGQHTMCFHESAIRKIVVCSPDLVVAAHADLGLLFHRPGMHSTWSLAESPSTACNIALYRGKLYSISIDGELFVHEFSSEAASTHHGHGGHVSSRFEIVIDTTPREEEGWSTHYLVVSCTGKLLMVRWRWRLPISYTVRRWCSDELSKEIKLDVFEADLEKSRWSEVKEIGDQALFVGTTCSKALPLPDHGNRIFFLGFNITEYSLGGIIHGIVDCAYCVYDMKNGTFKFDNPVSIKREGLSYGSEGSLSQRWRADWFFPYE